MVDDMDQLLAEARAGLQSVDDFAAEALHNDEEAEEFAMYRWVHRLLESVHDARERLGLTQEELGERLGTDQAAISRLENGNEAKLTRVWKALSACGLAPCEVELVPKERILEHLREQPTARFRAEDLGLNSAYHAGARAYAAGREAFRQYAEVAMRVKTLDLVSRWDAVTISPSQAGTVTRRTVPGELEAQLVQAQPVEKTGARPTTPYSAGLLSGHVYYGMTAGYPNQTLAEERAA